MVMALLVQLTENNNEIQSSASYFKKIFLLLFFLDEGYWKIETNLVFFVLTMHKLI